MTLVGQVEQASRRADDDVDPCAEHFHLRFVRTTAVDRQQPYLPDGRGRPQVSGDLHGELTSWDDHQSLRFTRRGGRFVVAVGRRHDSLQERKPEREGLARAGTGLADDVAANERDRQGHLLDREGFGDADPLEGVGDRGKYSEVSERGAQAARLFSRRVPERWLPSRHGRLG